MTRDLTKEQFRRKCEEYGFKPMGFWGYYCLGPGLEAHHVSIWNAGERRRSQLAYLIQMRDRELAKSNKAA